VRDRADDVQTGVGCAREGELSVPEVRRDVRSVQGGQRVAPTAGEGGAELDAVRKEVATRELAFHAKRSESRRLINEPTASVRTWNDSSVPALRCLKRRARPCSRT